MLTETLRLPNTFSYSNTKYYMVLFILWPFLAFIIALANYSQKEAKKIVYLFLIYFGLTFFISTQYYMDSLGYAKSLLAHAELPFSDFFKIVGGLYSETSVDIIAPLISFIVSRFTSFHGVLFAVYAAIYGFFYLKSINLLYDKYKESQGINALVFLIYFILILPITSINGFRMWTAAWIFFYGAYHVIINRDKKYLLLALLASLVHFSFISANVILLIYFIAGNRNIIYLPLAFISFVLPNIFSSIFGLVAGRLGGSMQARYQGYSSQGYIEGTQESLEQASWFIKIGGDLVFYFLLLAIIIIQLRSANIKKGRAERNLFSFLLLFLAFVNFGMAIPTLGGRFRIVFFIFATLYVFMYFIKNSGKNINLISWIGLFPMLLYVAVEFRMGSESINTMLFTPGLGLPLLVDGMSIADLFFR